MYNRYLISWKELHLFTTYYIACRSPDSHPLLIFYLQSHAAALEVVRVDGMGHCTLLSAALAAVTNLRELSCPLLDELHLLLQCRSLEALTLHVAMEDSPRGGHALAGAEQLLREATQLTRVTLKYAANQNGPAVNLVKALAVSGRSAIRFLDIDISEGDDRWADELPALQCEPLAAALPKLPHLETLVLQGNPSVVLLSAIRRDATPRLSHLTLEWARLCDHTMIHQLEVSDMLRRDTGSKTTKPHTHIYFSCRIRNKICR